MNLSFSRTQL